MSDEPRRYVDDPTRPPDLRADLARALGATPAFDPDRGLSRLEAAIATMALPAAPTAAAGAHAAGAKLATGLSAAARAWLLAGGLATAVGAAATGAWIGTHHRAAPSPRATPGVHRAPDAIATPPGPTAPGVAPPPTVVPAPAPTRPVVRAHASRGGRAAPAVTAPIADGVSPAQRENALLAQARALEVSHQYAAELDVLARSEREFPSGVTAPDRQGRIILALIALGRTTDARARATPYLARFPDGTHSERIRRLLGLAGAGAP